jgi:type IV secretion system protein VirD4
MGFLSRVSVVAPISTAQQRHPQAAYSGIYLGRAMRRDGSDGTGKRLNLRYRSANLNMLTFGAPGALKSAGLIAPNIAHLPQSMIIIDPKGQLAAITARKRMTMGPVIILNPLGLFKDALPHLTSHGWNPLLQLTDGRDFEQDAGSVADAIVTKADAGTSNTKFFDISAERLISLFVMNEVLENPKTPSLRNVVTSLSEQSVYAKGQGPVGGFAFHLSRMMQSDNFAVRTMATRIMARLRDADSHNTSLQDVIDTALKDFSFLNDDRVAYDMQEGRIDWGQLHREVTTIYLILPVQDLDPYGMGKWLRLFVNLALRGLYQNPPAFGEEKLPRVLFILDEFAQLGRLQAIPKALGVARDYSITLWFVLQNLAQLKTHYPKEWSLFFTGSGAKNCFRPGDFETAEYFSKLIGNAERYVLTENQSGGASLTPHAIPLIRPEDLMRLGKGMTVNLIDPCPYPILAEVPVYTQTPWNEGLDLNPYFRG